MKHIFIINPAAGKKDSRQRVYTMAEALKKNHNLDVECMLTKSRGHATALTRAIAETGDYVRFYACGGDGTVNEIANGIAGFPNAAMTCIPIGSYYGGGSTPVPEARMTDGVLHTVLVKNVSKARFATLFGGYSAGDYKKLPQDIIRVSTAKVVRIEALEGDLTTCLDGESMHSQCVTLKLADKKVNFFAPKGCDPDATAR